MAISSETCWRRLVAIPLLLGCSKPTPPPAEPPRTVTPPVVAEPAAPKVGVVEGSVVFVDCPDKINAKEAEATVNRLVESCDEVPGRAARFRATLEPGGRIDISAPDGSNHGLIPICVLKHRLVHRIGLRKSCQIEVEIEERRI